MSPPNHEQRVVILIVDGCGIGAAPDAGMFGDLPECNTIGNVAKRSGGLRLPNLSRLGIGNISAIEGVGPADEPEGLYGKLRELSNGKDTQTGHWEMMGVVSATAFPTYPNGFPADVIDRFIAETGCKGVLCNRPASGTEVIAKLGDEHRRTGFPIVYTSGDSVFQIACHIETVPLATQYEWCKIARKMLEGKHRVGRVICRPFAGDSGQYQRLGGDRRDYAVPPPEPTLLDHLRTGGLGVLGIGKIEDIFNRKGISHAQHTGTNREGLKLTLKAVEGELDLKPLAICQGAPDAVHLIFTNLVDTDMLFGHRRDVKGYANALVEIDQWLGKIIDAMTEHDLLVITSDHGNDPTAPGTDHTREYVPVLMYSPGLLKLSASCRNVGERNGFVDIAATVAHWLALPWHGPGVSCIPELSRVG